MMDRTVADAALIEAARSIALLVRACRDEGERERRLPAQVLAAMLSPLFWYLSWPTHPIFPRDLERCRKRKRGLFVRA